MIDYLAELQGTDLLLEAVREAERVLPQRGEAARREDEALPGAAEAPWRGEAEELVRLPLLEAVETAERRAVWSVTAPEQEGGGGRTSGPWEEMFGQENRRRGGERGAATTEGLTLRQVDRAFQRDGRRYDSGFFLY